MIVLGYTRLFDGEVVFSDYVVTTRKCTTAGAPETLTAGVFVFAGDLLAGGNPLPPAFFKSPVVSVIIPGAFLKSPAVLA
jgi:hypothetical protein